MQVRYRKVVIPSFARYTLVLCLGLVICLILFDFIAFLFLIMVILGFWPIVSAVLRKKGDVLSPQIVMPLTYMLYGLGPLFVASEYTMGVVIQYLLLQILGLLAMRLGARIASKSSAKYSPTPTVCTIESKERFVLLSTAVVLLILAIVSIATYLYAFGGLMNFLKVGYGGEYYLTVAEAQVLGSGFEWWLLAAVLLSFYGLKRHSKPLLFVGIALFMLMAFVVLYVGRRSQIIFPLVFGLVLLQYGHGSRRIPPIVLLSGLLLGIVAAQYYALARYFLPEGFTAAMSKGWIVVLRKPSLLLPWAANDFRVPAASLLEVLQYGGPHLLLGRSYIATLGAPIPFVARLFAKAGFNLNAWRLATLYPGFLEAGRGLGFSPVTEGYVNFGAFGVISQLGLYGYVMTIIYVRISSKPTVSNLLLLAGSLPIFMLDAMRATSGVFVYRWTRGYLMPWILFLLITLVVVRPMSRSAGGEARRREA